MNDCFLCDSTVSFAVWQTEGDSWADDSLFQGVGATRLDEQGTAPDFSARYVYLYQVVNTNHVPLPFVDPGTGEVIEEEGKLVSFQVINREAGASLFTSGGYFNTVFEDSVGPVLGDLDADDAGNAGGDGGGNYTLAPVDFAGDQYAGEGQWQDFQADGTPSDDIAPDLYASPERNGGEENFSPILGPQGADDPSDRSPSARGIEDVALSVQELAGLAVPVGLDLIFDPVPPVLNSSGNVVNFAWEPEAFDVGLVSPVLFLTSNARPVYGFGSTQSFGFPGSAGDVPTTAPTPASLALLGLGMVAMGYQRRLRARLC